MANAAGSGVTPIRSKPLAAKRSRYGDAHVRSGANDESGDVGEPLTVDDRRQRLLCGFDHHFVAADITQPSGANRAAGDQRRKVGNHVRRGYRSGLEVHGTGFPRQRKNSKNATEVHVERARVQRVVA
jgi:hypothetical protein